jgi:AcrR family transcriptional regulator
MPKKVDRQARRTLIADALMRVAADRGLEAVSLRHVATEAGVSAGMVQHYFRTKDEMMAFALDVVRDRNQARVTEVTGRLGDDPPARLLLRALIAALLPLDDDSRDDGRVALAFLAYTTVRPEIAEPLRAETKLMTSFLAGLIPAPGGEPAAAGLLALMEGLGVYLLGGQYTAEEALGALDAHLDLLFAGDPEYRPSGG